MIKVTVIKGILLATATFLLVGCQEPVGMMKTSKNSVDNLGASQVFQPTESTSTEETSQITTLAHHKLLICIDAGHQKKSNNGQEPVAPGSKVMKAKVSSGTTGRYTHKPEYVLNLEVAKKLKKALLAKGYAVLMVRESHNVNISNKQRAELANKAKANLTIRIHADGDNNPKTKGASILLPSRQNKPTGPIFQQSYLAAQAMKASFAKYPQITCKGLQYRSDLTGFNWSKVPVILVEMGYMTNKKEDTALSTTSYQDLLVNIMVEGVQHYFHP